MTDNAGPRRYECNHVNYGPRCAVLYFFAHRVPEFIIGFHKFSSGYEILAPGYKFRGL